MYNIYDHTNMVHFCYEVFVTQKDAVFSAISSVLKDAGLSFTPGVTNANAILTKDLRYKVNEILIGQFLNKEIDMTDDVLERMNKLDDLKIYVSSLVSNWLRKDNRLNTNISSNKTNNDPQIKAMRHLMNAQQDEKKRAEIQSFIDKRIKELTE